MRQLVERGAHLFTHRWLNAVAVLAVGGAVVGMVLYFADSRELLGVPVWEKPLKFLISSVFYTLTFSWLYSFVEKGKRFAGWMGNLIAALLVIELVVIIGLAAVGTTSHFNVSTPFHIAMWSIMATAISLVWGATFLLGAGLWKSSLMAGDLRLAVRWALGLGLGGMAIAFTMTSPQPQQILPENWVGIAGAHTVGAGDGGPGLPFLGWSTEAGDLRISHFFGLHALQALPLLAIVLSLVISNYAARVGTITGFAVGYGLLVFFTYAQALLGLSIVDSSTALGLAVILGVGTIVGFGTYLRRAKTSKHGATLSA